MRLIHFAHPGKEIMRERLRGYLPEEMERGPKPKGLWVSDESQEEWSWSWWCKSEQPDWIEGTLAQEVVLVPDANILFIQSVDELDAFGARFMKQPEGWPDDLMASYSIDWPEVAKLYDGIVITPYLWSRRLHRGSSWYYGWDCASGCIWNPAAIDYIVDLPNMAITAIDDLEGVL